MPKTSNSTTANCELKSTAELKRFDATEIRNLTLDEINFVTGGSLQEIHISKHIDKATPIFFQVTVPARMWFRFRLRA